MPLDLVHPLRRVRCYAQYAPCPNRFAEVLRLEWREYDHPCLGIPRRHPTAREVALIIERAFQLDHDGYCSFLDELDAAGYLGGQGCEYEEPVSRRRADG